MEKEKKKEKTYLTALKASGWKWCMSGSFTFHRPRQVMWPHLSSISQGSKILSQEGKASNGRAVIKPDTPHPI